MAYIDTSVLVAYYCPEPLSKAAEKFIRQADDLTISQLTEVEFCSALAIKTRTGELTTETAHHLLSCFRMHCVEGIYRMVSIGAKEYSAACEWITSFSTPLKTGDALHLAAAFSNQMTLITADKALATAAKTFRIKHKLIS